MKTTLDLPDDLLIEAKQVAARRRTTLRDLITRSLRREIGQQDTPAPSPGSPYEIGPFGILRLKNRSTRITPEALCSLQNEIDQEEFDAAMKLRHP
ncbi:MAG: hypothetical protein NTV46_22420 [Verrucomicrobia bacterium]|nr:hypothetical protein [Verrucomicrobiota bacterium]